MRIAPALALLALAPLTLRADVRLPAVFGDHMVLQRGRPVPVFGTCAPGEEVTVELAGQRATGRGNGAGRFSIEVGPLEAGGPHRLVVRGKNELAFDDVLVGEVWICSGQSNMEWSVKRAKDPEQEIAAADRPRLRLFKIPRTEADEPAADVQADWVACSPETVGDFSAVGYSFGRELLQELDVPIGMIQASWGGTRAEAWIRKGAFAGAKDLAHLADNPHGRKGRNRPSVLYNGMIAPLIPFAVQGAIWYQGEANVGFAHQYRRLFRLLIESWRRDWGGGDFPFYFVQLAPFRYNKGDAQMSKAAAELREAQMMGLGLPNTGMAVTLDIGNPSDIHPREKREVGRRLALWALANDYGRDELVCSGPLFRSMTQQDGALRLKFLYAEGGLGTRDGEPVSHLEVAGPDQVFHPAVGRIDESELVVSSPEVPAPVAARYGWEGACEPNLQNASGLPASSFRTDDWPGVTYEKK